MIIGDIDMDDELTIEGFLSFSSEGVILSDYGILGTRKLLERYSDGQIREIAKVSRSALSNYVSRKNRISKRGQDALQQLIRHYNRETKKNENSTTNSHYTLSHFSDHDLMHELKKRGFNVFVSI